MSFLARAIRRWLTAIGRFTYGTADYRDRYDTWVSWLDEQGVEGVGFGWITLRRAPGEPGRMAGRMAPT